MARPVTDPARPEVARQRSGGRTRVVIVAEARPARGGIATFAETVADDIELNRELDLTLLNTTRRAVRRGGEASVANAFAAIADAWRVARLARRADVVHVQTAFMPLLPLLRALLLCVTAKAMRAAVVCHVHTGLVNESTHESFRPGRAMRALLPLFARVDAIATVSDAAIDGLRPWIRSGRFLRVDNAIDVQASAMTAPATPPRVTYVGAIGRSKGLTDLLEATVSLRRRGIVDWSLQIVGGANQLGAEEAAAVRRAYEGAGLGDAFVGETDAAGARALLAGSAVAVLPSWSEGQPLAIIEAMAAGVPVVATSVGAVPDMVRDGVDGIVVPPRDATALADALGTLLANDARRAAMGASARTRAEERYDLPRLRAALLDLYRAVTAGGVAANPTLLNQAES